MIGAVTSTTPVLLGHGERAALATERYAALTPLLEGFVIVRSVLPDAPSVAIS